MGWVCCIDSHHFSRSARLKYQRFLPFLSPPGICPSRAHRRNDDAGIPVSSESCGIVTALLRSSAEKSGLVFISHTSYTMKILCVLKANQNECNARTQRNACTREKFLKLFLTVFSGRFPPSDNSSARCYGPAVRDFSLSRHLRVRKLSRYNPARLAGHRCSERSR